MKNIQIILNELDRHAERLTYSKTKIIQWGNITSQTLQNPDNVEIIDSFIFRFSKMQDTMGETLFPAALTLVGEYKRSMSFIDILNKLEQLELIDRMQTWQAFRKTRNLFAHTYPWETQDLISGIKLALQYSDKLIAIYEKIKNYIEQYKHVNMDEL